MDPILKAKLMAKSKANTVAPPVVEKPAKIEAKPMVQENEAEKRERAKKALALEGLNKKKDQEKKIVVPLAAARQMLNPATTFAPKKEEIKRYTPSENKISTAPRKVFGGGASGNNSKPNNNNFPKKKVNEEELETMSLAPDNKLWKQPDVNDLKSNVHCGQVWINDKKWGYVSRTDMKFTRILAPDAEKMVYRQRKGEEKTVIHWGQRKLLICEIEFLTMFYRPRPANSPKQIVVYAGAAPGTHIKMVAELFPDMMFYLYDPAPFTVKERSGGNNNIIINQELFTDDVAKKFAGYNCLFICDIRAADHSRLSHEENQKQIEVDMQDQMRWHEIMKPEASELKFRLPWTPGKTIYLDGTIYLPIWGPVSTTESRLIVQGPVKKREYDNIEYEQQMFFHNTTRRVARYAHDVSYKGICHCYDCTGEIHVWKEYINACRYNEVLDDVKKAKEMLTFFIDNVAIVCGNTRSLTSGNVDREELQQSHVKKQYLEGRPAYETAKRKASEMLEQSGTNSGFGFEQMKKMGFNPGEGLGKNNTGISLPIQAAANPQTRGLGYDSMALLENNNNTNNINNEFTNNNFMMKDYEEVIEEEGEEYRKEPPNKRRRLEEEVIESKKEEGEIDPDF